MSYDLQVKYLASHFIVLHILKVANGPLKTMGLTKFWSNLTGLAVLFFSGYVHLTTSIFAQSCLGG